MMKVWIDIALAGLVIFGAFGYLVRKALDYKALAEAEREARENAERNLEKLFKVSLEADEQIERGKQLIYQQNQIIRSYEKEVNRMEAILKNGKASCAMQGIRDA